MKNVHRIAIPTILEVGSKKLTQPGYLLNKHKLKKVVLFFCEGIYELFGQIIEESLSAYSEVEVIEKFTSKDNNMLQHYEISFLPYRLKLRLLLGLVGERSWILQSIQLF